MKHVTITQHAVDRYRQRFRARRSLDRTIIDRLRHYWAKGEVMRRTGEEMQEEFRRHGCISERRRFYGVVMVVTNGRMATVMRHEKNYKPKCIRRLR
jgi:hypothetical protein